MRVLILSTTTGYQTRAFGEAAMRLGIDLVFATDRCHLLDDPWQDAAVAVKFHDEEGAVEAIVNAARGRPVHGILALGDRPTVIAARVAQALSLPGHPPGAAMRARHKRLFRNRLADAGLAAPWVVPTSIHADARTLLDRVQFPCVLKPVVLSGSRGVIRANDRDAFLCAFDRLCKLLATPDVTVLRDPAVSEILVEGYVEGAEYAIEGVLERGELHALAVFDKPDPLEGPFFEETIYVTPALLSVEDERRIIEAIAEAARAVGLWHGPIHAECRVSPSGVTVLEVAARPIGGLCAGALRFRSRGEAPGETKTLEELLLRHAVGEPLACYDREAAASGVMMIPIPRRGYLRRTRGLKAAASVDHVTNLVVSAKQDQLLVPLPEGASYLGFIFASAPTVDAVVDALRAAHARLRFDIGTMPMLLPST